MACSRSSVTLRIAGKANFLSIHRSTRKTAQVQKNRPKFTSNGETGPACSAPSWTRPTSSMSVIGTSSDQLEQQGKDQRDDRDALEEHREQQTRSADFTRRLRLTGDRLGHLAANATQADSAADHRQTQSDTGAEQAVDVLGRFDAEAT